MLGVREDRSTFLYGGPVESKSPGESLLHGHRRGEFEGMLGLPRVGPEADETAGAVCARQEIDQVV